MTVVRTSSLPASVQTAHFSSAAQKPRLFSEVESSHFDAAYGTQIFRSDAERRSCSALFTAARRGTNRCANRALPIERHRPS